MKRLWSGPAAPPSCRPSPSSCRGPRAPPRTSSPTGCPPTLCPVLTLPFTEISVHGFLCKVSFFQESGCWVLPQGNLKRVNQPWRGSTCSVTLSSRWRARGRTGASCPGDTACRVPGRCSSAPGWRSAWSAVFKVRPLLPKFSFRRLNYSRECSQIGNLIHGIKVSVPSP